MMNPVKTQRPFLLVLALVTVFLSSVQADEVEDAEKEEQARQESFRAGFAAIVDDLNNGSLERFTSAVDPEDMLDRIYGLRLIDQKVKKQFGENIEGSFAGLIQSGVVPKKGVPESGLKVRLLGVESRGTLGRAVVRFDLEKQQFSYHEYDLRLGKNNKVIIVDWTDFLAGMTFSESIGRFLVMQAPSKSALRKLLDFQNVNERELFQFGELMKSARDRRLDRYLEIRNAMHARFQRQRIIVETSVSLAKEVRNRREMVAALQIMAEHFPEEPLYSLMLLDHFFPSKKLAEGSAALQRLSDRLDFEDAAMSARLSAVSLAMGNAADAVAYADVALAHEPTLELAWISAFSARAALSDFAAAVEAASKLEAEFGRDLDPETLGKSQSYAQLLNSPDYKRWREALN
jgi:hypothetical protein